MERLFFHMFIDMCFCIAVIGSFAVPHVHVPHWTLFQGSHLHVCSMCININSNHHFHLQSTTNMEIRAASKETTRTRDTSDIPRDRRRRRTQTNRVATCRQTETVTCTHSYSWLCAIAPAGEEFISWTRRRAHPVLFLPTSTVRRK